LRSLLSMRSRLAKSDIYRRGYSKFQPFALSLSKGVSGAFAINWVTACVGFIAF
jgi:hypothetical protein